MRGLFLILLQLGVISGGGFLPHDASAAPTVTLTATPASGVSPLNVSLTWSSTGADNCTASGGWSGAKALSGTQALTGVTATTTYTLTCSMGSGSATLSWTNPTQNTDNTPLTDLAGTKAYWSTTTAGVSSATPTILNSPTTTSYVINGLAAGTWYFGVKAYTTKGVDSAMSVIVNKTIVLASASADAVVTINTVPKPPVIVTVNQVAYEIRRNVFGDALGRVVGTINLGVPCDPSYWLNSRGALYYEVPTEAVHINKPPKSDVLVALCKAG